MTTFDNRYVASGRLARDGRLTDAVGPLAELQALCGGQSEGVLAVPELRAIAAKATAMQLRLSRPFTALAPSERITGWVDAMPDLLGGGCTLSIATWQSKPISAGDDVAQVLRLRRELNRAMPEFTAHLDQRQAVLMAQSDAPDLADLAARMMSDPGHPWTDFVTLADTMHDQPLHWRLLDGAACEVSGSPRRWTAWLEPLGKPEAGQGGFVLTLVSDTPLPPPEPADAPGADDISSRGEELAPALRQPVNRVIAQAETIRSKLAGPLADIYAGYAGDMVDAGEHLLALIEDIADLEGVEADSLPVQLDRIDLGDSARQACAILGARAQQRDIALVPPPAGESQWARGETRRVMQVLINLIGNAIAYSPEESQVWIRLDREGRRATVTVADQGRGLSAAEQARVFDKFERLGRSGDGGSGLGLYIAARLARAMHGTITVESAPGQGARFALSLPALD